MKLKTGLLDEMHQWLERCPHCKQIWMIFNRKNGEQHLCKACGNKFTLGEQKVEPEKSMMAAEKEAA
jgi:rRNA maturation endonuclease Nob1